jgi:hypothetical protein
VLVFDTSTSMRVLRADAATNEVVATIPIDSDFSRRIAAADGAIWVEEHRSQDPVGNGSYLAKIDPATNEVVATLPNGLFGAFDPDQDVIWTTTGYALARIDPMTTDFIGDPTPIRSAIRGFGLAAAEGGVWFFGYVGRCSLVLGAVRFDGQRGRRVSRIAVPQPSRSSPCEGLDLDGESRWLGHSDRPELRGPDSSLLPHGSA